MHIRCIEEKLWVAEDEISDEIGKSCPEAWQQIDFSVGEGKVSINGSPMFISSFASSIGETDVLYENVSVKGSAIALVWLKFFRGQWEWRPKTSSEQLSKWEDLQD